MWPLLLTLPVGLVLGLVLTFTHKSMEGRGIAARVAIGVVAGLGISIVLNAVVEALEFAGLG